MEPAALGRVGVWLSEHRGVELAVHAAERGFSAVWVGGVASPESLRPYVEAIASVPVASGIVNIWRSEPASVAAEFAELERSHPGRLLLGIGAGHPEATSEFRAPVSAMARYFDGLDESPTPVPRESRVAAALGPRMLELAAERSLGAHPYFVPAEHTASARTRLGGALLAPEVAVAIAGDRDTSRAWARQHAKTYVGLTNYTRNLRDFGFTDDDFADGGSDRLIDAVIPNGSIDAVVAGVRAHFDAGADHVCIQPVGPRESLRGQLDELAAALL